MQKRHLAMIVFAALFFVFVGVLIGLYLAFPFYMRVVAITFLVIAVSAAVILGFFYAVAWAVDHIDDDRRLW